MKVAYAAPRVVQVKWPVWSLYLGLRLRLLRSFG